MDVLRHSLVYSTTSNMFIEKLFIIISALFSFTLACHSKGNRKPTKIIEKECNFINVSDSHDLSYEKEGYTENPISRKKYVFFNASKPNIATLPCYTNKVKLFEFSNDLRNEYLVPIPLFMNSPTECQTFCQRLIKCHFFTYKLETNQCWFFHKGLDYSKKRFYAEGYISGPKYCKTLQPISKGGFEIQVYNTGLKFNGTHASHTYIPKTRTHAWESCKRICSLNDKCTSFDYCFQEEKKSYELFMCYMKGNTSSEAILKSPRHCVKSVKQNCSVI